MDYDAIMKAAVKKNDEAAKVSAINDEKYISFAKDALDGLDTYVLDVFKKYDRNFNLRIHHLVFSKSVSFSFSNSEFDPYLSLSVNYKEKRKSFFSNEKIICVSNFSMKEFSTYLYFENHKEFANAVIERISWIYRKGSQYDR